MRPPTSRGEVSEQAAAAGAAARAVHASLARLDEYLTRVREVEAGLASAKADNITMSHLLGRTKEKAAQYGRDVDQRDEEIRARDSRIHKLEAWIREVIDNGCVRIGRMDEARKLLGMPEADEDDDQ